MVHHLKIAEKFKVFSTQKCELCEVMSMFISSIELLHNVSTFQNIVLHTVKNTLLLVNMNN
jgi:hypothetical protein